MLQSDYICRVCLAEGVWNIFGTNAINDEMCTVASINFLRDKLQYVTDLQLHEDDGLPLRICELCILQLNVAYRFKKLATESDTRLRESLEIREQALALTSYDNVPEVQAEPEVVIKLEDTSKEITIEPTQIIENRFDSCPLLNEPIVPNAKKGLEASAMVFINKDIINPTEDEQYLQEIIKKEVISMPLPIVSKRTTDKQNAFPLTTIRSEQSEKRRKQTKSPRKRNRSGVRPDGLENEAQNRKKVQTKTKQQHSKPSSSKKQALQLTTVSTTPSHESSNSMANSTTEATKKRTKLAKATLRKKRLQKVLNDLHIDMTFNNSRKERHSLMGLQSKPNAESPGLMMITKRRNSVCVSSFAPWL